MSALPPPTSTSSVSPASSAGVVAQRLAHRHVGEAVLLGAVDHLDVDAGAQPDAVEEGVAVRGLAHRARRDRAVADDAVGVHDPAEALERLQRRLDGGRAQAAVREGVLAEQHAARGLLQDARGLAGRRLGDQQADGGRAQVEHGQRPRRLGRRRRRVLGGERAAAGGRHQASGRRARRLRRPVRRSIRTGRPNTSCMSSARRATPQSSSSLSPSAWPRTCSERPRAATEQRRAPPGGGCGRARPPPAAARPACARGAGPRAAARRSPRAAGADGRGGGSGRRSPAPRSRAGGSRAGRRS